MPNRIVALTLSIVSHGHEAFLPQLLDDIARLPSLKNAHVIVTLNVPQTFDAAKWPGLAITVVRNSAPKGFGANHNAAFEHCSSHLFVVLNPDLRLPADPFPILVSRMDRCAALGLAAPRVIDSAGQPEDSIRDNLTPADLVRRSLRRLNGKRRLEGLSPDSPRPPFFWVAGMFMIFRSDAFREIGKFDERFFLYCEDYDICARLRRAGWDIDVERNAVVVHDAQRDSQRSWRHLRWHLGSLARVWTSSVFWWTVFEAGTRTGR